MRLLLLALALSVGTAHAASKHPPLPEEVYKAKTVFIANQSGYQSTADGAYEALRKWGAFEVVSNKAKADLVLTFTYGGDGLVNGTSSWGVFIMTVQLQGTNDAVFQTSSGGGGFHIPSNRGGFAAKDCVNQFKKRMAEPH